MPGRHIRFGGPVTGSRYGVRQVLDQGFGHCWDFSDVCVTLCRAAGVPSRQVAGWLHEQSGHIWAEVLLEGKGWQQVDPTAGMACGSDYIPYLVSETGEMTLVYLSMPQVEVSGGE
jgi:transglutaminase-like putative cysteine protease